MIKLEKGAKVKVRLHTGEVVEAVYDAECKVNHKNHWIDAGGYSYYSSNKIHTRFDCRLVGNPCVLVPVGVSV